MNLHDLYEMRDRRDAYQRDYDSSVSGMSKRDSYAYSQDGGGNDESHELDPTEWYIVKDGKMFKATVYPNQVQSAMSQGYSPSREEARAKAEQGMAEGSLEEVDRRGFLKGLGAAAVAGAAGSVMAQSDEEIQARARLEKLRAMQGMHRATQTGQDTDKNYSKDVSYGHKIIRRIKPNIMFMVDKIEGNPEAIVEIRCAPDGTILSRKLTKSSGNTEWDQAVIRAIDKSESIPQDVDGKVPSPITISFRPLSESVNQGVAEGSQRVDSLVTDALKIMQGATMNDAVAALKTVLGNREYNDRRGHYSFYVKQLMDMYGQQGVTETEADSDGHSVDHADSGEYDYEGDQAKDQLNTIVRAAQRLNGLLDDNENMPEWVQMKITNAADYIDTAADYIESNQEPELAEGDKIGNMDADKFDAAMARLKQLAGAGPLKTVYDPTKRVYRNVPVAVQPKK